MRAELRLTDDQFRVVSAYLLPDEDEHAAALICGTTAEGTTMLCRRVVPLEGADLEASGRLHLRVSPIALARLAKQARLEDATLVVCHSHPFPGPVHPSSIDLETEAELCGRVLPGRLGDRPAASLILGPDGLNGRLWRNGRAYELTVVVGGHRVDAPLTSDEPDERESRQMRLWGHDGQARLRDLRVVVVGAGGTGSHVAVQLAHLGVGHLVLVDFDVLERSNLSRVIGSTDEDVGESKVAVLANSIMRIRPETTVSAIPASIVDMDAATLAEHDVIVCCTDGHGSRALLTELASQYLMPLIDLGVEVQPGDRGSRAGGGVRVIRPGDPCLHCMAVLDPMLVREEFLRDDERAVERARGYLRGVDEPEPSVVALNGVVASLAVIELLDVVLGLFGPTPPRLLYRAEARAVTAAAVDREPACWVCGDAGLLGLGDARPLPRRTPQPRTGLG